MSLRVEQSETFAERLRQEKQSQGFCLFYIILHSSLYLCRLTYIASYRQALQIDPNDAVAHNNLGVALDNQGKLDEAIAELEIAVHLEPTNALFRQNLETIRNKNKGFLRRLFG